MPPKIRTADDCLKHRQKTGHASSAERNTQCPWCSRWFKGQIGLRAHGRRNQSTCGALLDTLVAAAADRLIEMTKVRDALWEHERTFRQDPSLKTDQEAVQAYVQAHIKALRLARLAGDPAPLKNQAAWASSHLQLLGMARSLLFQILKLSGLPESELLQIAAKGADLAAYWLSAAS